MPRKHMIESTDEFINITSNLDKKGLLASLDVTSLFTHVPVHETIEIILNNVYNHEVLPPPRIPKTIMKTLLITCTTETPFTNINGDLYLQTDGVSMGSPLGPLFANFYMANLENKVLEKASNKPLVYARYVDDIFIVADNIATLDNLKTDMEKASVLQFTYEIESKKTISFLDTLIKRENNGTLKTSVFTKSTNSGECLNYHSITPDQYKSGVIKTLLHRAYKISSDWITFHKEVMRIQQLLTNNNYPMEVIEKEVKKFMDRKQNSQCNNNLNTNKIELFYRNQMSSSYKHEEKQLRKIIKENVNPVAPSTQVQLRIYYRNRKLSNLFIKNSPRNDSSDFNVVYQYTCPSEQCQLAHTYIGYTECTLKQRMTYHCTCGSIKNHNKTAHQKKICTKELLESTTILRKESNKEELMIAEALLIKEKKPTINLQNDGFQRTLLIF